MLDDVIIPVLSRAAWCSRVLSDMPLVCNVFGKCGSNFSFLFPICAITGYSSPCLTTSVDDYTAWSVGNEWLMLSPSASEEDAWICSLLSELAKQAVDGHRNKWMNAIKTRLRHQEFRYLVAATLFRGRQMRLARNLCVSLKFWYILWTNGISMNHWKSTWFELLI